MNRMVVIVLVCLAATALWGVAATVLWGVTVFYPWYKQHAADPLSITGPAEELDMTNGPKSREVMVDIIGNQVITCVPDGTHSYNRIVASCFLPDGTDISHELVHRGWALDCFRYSHGRYRADEPAGVRQKLFQARYC